LVGIGQHRRPEILSFADHPHWLVAGTSGGGKSNAVNSFIATWLRFVKPEDLKLILIDLKQVEFKLYKDIPHLEMPVVTNGEEAVNVLDGLMKEIHDRNSLLSRHDEKELSEWNSNHPTQKMPRIVVIIDELAELMLSSGSEVRSAAKTLIERISNLGRAVGVNIVAATQLPTTEVIPLRVTGNMTASIAVRSASWRQSQTILGVGLAAKLPNVRGRVVYKHGAELMQLQTALITLDNIKYAAKIAKGRAAGVITLVEQHPFLDGDGMICWIMDHLEGRLNTKALADAGRALAVPMTQLRALVEDLIRKPRVEANGREFEICPTPQGWRLEEIAPKIEFHLEASKTLEHLTGETPAEPGEPQFVIEPEAEAPQVELDPGPVMAEKSPLLLSDDQVLDKFLRERCTVGARQVVRTKEFYAAYCQFCNALNVTGLTKPMVGKAIQRRGFERVKRSPGNQMHYLGVSLNAEFAEGIDSEET
jgi:hypothetical protein